MNDHDPVFLSFLEAQVHAAISFAQESDIVELLPYPSRYPGQKWLATFRCRSLAGNPAAGLRENPVVEVGIFFRSDYLREVHPGDLITILNPPDLFAPNVREMHVCAEWTPGLGLTDILHTLYEVFTFQLKNTVHGLNPRAMEWALQNAADLPLERRPLRRIRHLPQTPAS